LHIKNQLPVGPGSELKVCGGGWVDGGGGGWLKVILMFYFGPNLFL
jgi:hypothetical protein